MRFSLHVDQATVNELQTALRGLPHRVEVNVMRGAVRKASQVILEAIRLRVPVQEANKNSQMPHLRDTVVLKKREYKSGKTGKIIYTAVGYGTGIWGGGRKPKPNSHLVEYGTAARFTNHETKYVETGKKKIKTKKGWFFKRTRKSIGSKQKMGGPKPAYRGVMPAFRPTTSAYSAAANQAREAMINEIRAGIPRAIKAATKRNAKAFGGLGS